MAQHTFRTEFKDAADEHLYYEEIGKNDTRTNGELLREALHLIRIVWHRLGSDTAISRFYYSLQEQVARFNGFDR